ncbi:uridine kinase [Flammeovirgaceae bacterium SG7u.111]|nr:uridine kinase [Flammeovirgaceae bacterium SG7u.132]WPO36574.1 uridine kinase [Flammeovirgaceae bacterium SG7u.111]
MKQPYLIGITGGSGSGKTFFLQKLLEAVGDEKVTLISQDNYYRKRSEQPRDIKGFENFDTPESIDRALFADHISQIKAGEEVVKEEYTFNNPQIKPKIFTFKPSPVVIVEGIFVLHYTEIAKQIDLKVFIETYDYIRLRRRIDRDQKERGYDLEDVLYRFENHVMPSYKKFIEPHKGDADFIVNNHLSCDNSLEVITSFIKSKIS